MQGSWLVSSSAWEARGRSWHADCSPARLSPPVHSVLRESSPEPGLSPLESFLTAELFSGKLSPHCLHRKPVCVCVYVRVCVFNQKPRCSSSCIRKFLSTVFKEHNSLVCKSKTFFL